MCGCRAMELRTHYPKLWHPGILNIWAKGVWELQKQEGHPEVLEVEIHLLELKNFIRALSPNRLQNTVLGFEQSVQRFLLHGGKPILISQDKGIQRRIRTRPLSFPPVYCVAASCPLAYHVPPWPSTLNQTYCRTQRANCFSGSSFLMRALISCKI